MRVKRIVPNFEAKALAPAKAFYGGLLGLEIIMDHGWIVTFGCEEPARPQISIATQGGSDTAVPDVSIEVTISRRRWSGFKARAWI